MSQSQVGRTFCFFRTQCLRLASGALFYRFLLALGEGEALRLFAACRAFLNVISALAVSHNSQYSAAYIKHQIRLWTDSSWRTSKFFGDPCPSSFLGGRYAPSNSSAVIFKFRVVLDASPARRKMRFCARSVGKRQFQVADASITLYPEQ